MSERTQAMTFWLPPSLVRALTDAAAKQGQSAESFGVALLSASLEQQMTHATSPLIGNDAMDTSKHADPAGDVATLMRHAGVVDLGHATGTSNAEIDDDLVREYGTCHGSPR
jgi:hypothetical protein